MTNLSKINLNLLLALDALLTQHNVSKAAQQCHVTQSAMSLSLKQLRDIFQDELLIRGQASSMQLSNKEINIIEPVKQAINQLEQVFMPKQTLDLKSIKRDINIGMPEYIADLLFTKIFKVVQRHAPNIVLNIRPLQRIESIQPFVQRQFDLAIGFVFNPPDALRSVELFEERAICVAKSSHPVFRLSSPFYLKDLARYPQIIWSMREHYAQTSTGQWYRARNIKRHVLASVTQAEQALEIVEQSEAITIMPKGAFAKFRSKNLSSAPVEFPAKQVRMFWHEMTHNDPVLQWIREQIKQIVATLN